MDQTWLNFSPGLVEWMRGLGVSLAFTTYSTGKTVLAGPGDGDGVAVSECCFGSAMAMTATGNGLTVGTLAQIWYFENGLQTGQAFRGHDRLYLPRSCHVTGAVDVHDIAYGADGRMVIAVTLYNCLAIAGGRGNFNPIWRPPFIDRIEARDCWHLNGFCLENGVPAYATLVGWSNQPDGWRDHRADGGVVIDTRCDEAVVRGLAMPHSPRLYRGRLWVLEAGSGWFGWIDVAAGRFERIAWCPGFLRGLRFHGDYAVIGLSKPRNKVFAGLPIDGELAARGREPECGIHIIDLRDGQLAHSLRIDDCLVEEIYDVAVLPGTRQPLIIGLEGEDIANLVVFGPANSDAEDLISLAGSHRAQGRLAEAEPLLRRALALQERAFGPAHPNIVASLNNLALICHALKRPAEAEPLLRRALDIQESVLGPEHPAVAAVRRNLAAVSAPELVSVAKSSDLS